MNLKYFLRGCIKDTEGTQKTNKIQCIYKEARKACGV
jgi:hypothetical protein